MSALRQRQGERDRRSSGVVRDASLHVVAVASEQAEDLDCLVGRR